MNWESWLPPKNSFMAADTGRMLIRALGVALSISWIVIRSRTTRSMRSSPMRNAFWISSPLARMRRFPRWSMSSGWPPPLLRMISCPTIAAMSSRVMVRPRWGSDWSSRGSSKPIRAAIAPSFLLNL